MYKFIGLHECKIEPIERGTPPMDLPHLNTYSPRSCSKRPVAQLTKHMIMIADISPTRAQSNLQEAEMSLDHIGIYVEPRQLDNMVKFYLDALKPLGYVFHCMIRVNTNLY